MIMSRPEAGGPEDRELAFTVVFVYNNYRIDNLPAPGNSTRNRKNVVVQATFVRCLEGRIDQRRQGVGPSSCV